MDINDNRARILFVCSTKLLLFNALHVRMHMFPNAKADIIFDFSRPETVACAERIRQTKLFDNVAFRLPPYVDFKEYFSLVRNNQPAPSLFTAIKNTVNKYDKIGHGNADSREQYLGQQIYGYEKLDISRYTHIFGYGNTDTIRNIISLTKEKNKTCKMCVLEEGIGSYFREYICSDIKPDSIFLYSPNMVLYDDDERITKIPPIDKNDKAFIDCVNLVFNYRDKENVENKIIFFDDHASDMPGYLKISKLLSKTLLRNSYKKHVREMRFLQLQREAFELLCKYRNNREVIVKLHPTTKRNTIEEEYLNRPGVSVLEAAFAPWEVVCLNNDVHNNIIVTMMSAAVKGNSIFTEYKDNNIYIVLVDLVSDIYDNEKGSALLKKWSEQENIHVIFPQDIGEYEEYLKANNSKMTDNWR